MSKAIRQIRQPAQRPNITEQDINNGSIIYQGECCDVKEVVKGDNVYAVKCIYKNKIKKAIFDREIKQIANQISVLYKCNHPNIIQLKGHLQSENIIALFFPKFGKTLESFIQVKKKHHGASPYTLDIFVKIFRQVGEAIKQVHCLGYVHRDICPENFLMNKEFEIKLIDFGCVSPIWGRKTKIGTIEYMAPEILQAKPYNHKIDVWAFGVLCFELLYGTIPFSSKKKNLSNQQIEKQQIRLMMEPIRQFSPEDLILSDEPPTEMLDTIKCFLNFNPDKRPEIGAVLCKKLFGAQQEDSIKYGVQMLRSRTERKTTKLLNNLDGNTSEMSISELQRVLFSLISVHSQQLQRQKELLEHLMNSERKLTELRIQKYNNL